MGAKTKDRVRNLQKEDSRIRREDQNFRNNLIGILWLYQSNQQLKEILELVFPNFNISYHPDPSKIWKISKNSVTYSIKRNNLLISGLSIEIYDYENLESWKPYQLQDLSKFIIEEMSKNPEVCLKIEELMFNHI